MKGKPWTPSSLKAMGGDGRCRLFAFLEESFSADRRSSGHRKHQQAARAGPEVSLLPRGGDDIKGHMRSATIFSPPPVMRRVRKTSTTLFGS